MLWITDNPDHCLIVDSRNIVFIDPFTLTEQSETNPFPCGTDRTSYTDTFKITLEWRESLKRQVNVVKPKRSDPLHKRILWEVDQILSAISQNLNFHKELQQLESVIQHLEAIGQDDLEAIGVANDNMQ